MLSIVIPCYNEVKTIEKIVAESKSNYEDACEKGLKQALKRWRAAKDAGTLKTEKFMGMDIHPRIEIITPANITETKKAS